jgi:hypothetical protein
MEGGVNVVPGWELEEVGDVVDLPLHSERTNEAGTQLLAGQAEANVPGGQPDPIARLVTWGN